MRSQKKKKKRRDESLFLLVKMWRERGSDGGIGESRRYQRQVEKRKQMKRQEREKREVR